MKLSNKILAVLLAMTLATSQGLAWDDEQRKESGKKRKYVITGLVAVGVVAAGILGFKAWKYFDVGSMLKKKTAVDAEETVGIDLGTTKSGGGRGDEIIPDADGKTMTASAVLFDKDVKVVRTGDAALGDDGTITSAKRIIGMPKRIADEEKNFKVVADTAEGREHMAAIETIEGQVVSPEDVATEVLKGVKHRIDTHYGKDFRKAVISVPAYFFEFQKAATKSAGEATGFEKVTLINEPTAAAFAHGAAELDKKAFKKGVNYLVYDFGGGTMDISVVKASLVDGKKTFKVNSITGDPRLGGDDIDAKIAKKFAQDLGLDFDKADAATKRVLLQQAEKAKIHLSDVESTEYTSESFELLGKKFDVSITREQFDDEIEAIVDRTIDLTEESIKLAKNVELDDIDEVVLVGGSSRNLLVRQKLIGLFGEDRLAKSLKSKISPDEMVAKGAAKYAQILDTTEEYKLSNIVPISFRVDIKEGGEKGKLVSREVIKRFDDLPATGTTSGESLGEQVEIFVRQGESENPKENVLIGRFKLKGEQAGEGIAIRYEIDEDGLLEVTAKNTATNSVEKIKIDMNATPEDIDDVVEEAARGVDNLTEEQQLEALQQLLGGEQIKQLAEEVQRLGKGQAETHAAIIEIREMLQELRAASK